MKKLLIVALSVFSISAFAAQSNSGLNADLINKAVAAGLTMDEAVTLVATGKITEGVTEGQILETINSND